MYVRFPTTAHSLLMLVSQPAAHTQWLLALYDLGPLPSLLASFPAAPAPPWAYHQCPQHTETYVRTYDRFKASFGVQRLTAQILAQARLDRVTTPEATPLCTCILQLLYTLYSCLYPSLQPACGGSRPWTPPLSAHRFPCHLCSSMGVLSRFSAY